MKADHQKDLDEFIIQAIRIHHAAMFANAAVHQIESAGYTAMVWFDARLGDDIGAGVPVPEISVEGRSCAVVLRLVESDGALACVAYPDPIGLGPGHLVNAEIRFRIEPPAWRLPSTFWSHAKKWIAEMDDADDADATDGDTE